MNNKTIFWDMDGTLGFFEHLAYKETLNKIPDYLGVDFGLKSGIEELLTKLSDEGFTHHITTAATSDYAIEALSITGIDKYFNKLFTRETLCGEYGFGYVGPKNYNYPLKEIQIDLEQAKSDVIIIGDSTKDIPFNNDKIVSIIDYNNFTRSSVLLDKIIHLLLKEGDNDFNKGFHKIYSNSEKIDAEYTHLKQYGRIFLEDEVELHLRFMQEREKCSNAPFIKIIKANNYQTKIEAKEWRP
jgi:hypothetical protein